MGWRMIGRQIAIEDDEIFRYMYDENVTHHARADGPTPDATSRLLLPLPTSS